MEMLSFLLLAIALYTDLLFGKIYNAVTIPAIAFGVCSHGIGLYGGLGLGFSLSGLFAGIALLLAAFLLGGAGGGDVKLFAGIGALLGGRAVLTIFLYTAMIGGGICLVLLIKKKRWAIGTFILLEIQHFFLTQGKPVMTPQARTIPYTVPTVIGFFVFQCMGGSPQW